ncbi:MAG: 4Fe-4S dicluster domain-containing protein [Sandaracinaceae bacterium]|nr:4Fe-4S dicluster domain-containing protein [Sandaracinaceae bacterium]
MSDDGKRRLPVIGDEPQTGRRTFMNAFATAAGAVAAGVATAGCDTPEIADLFRQHYRRLTDEDKRELIARLEALSLQEHGVRAHISDPPPVPGVEFAYALDLSTCTGCRQCEYACAAENNTPRDPEMHYIRVLELERGSFDLEEAEHDYEGTVPREGKMYMPVSCMQCADPPCVSACPVDATWQEADGIVVIDYDWCIGCRYCQAACPYQARHFNFSEPNLRPSDINPDQGLLSNRVRPRGVMEKCHFCLHRTRRGLLPACQEACPVGARKFGNLNDPTSEVRFILETQQVYVLKEELGTLPRFFYYFG